MGKACQTNCDESNTSLTTHHTHHTRSADCKVLVNLVILRDRFWRTCEAIGEQGCYTSNDALESKKQISIYIASRSSGVGVENVDGFAEMLGSR
jgi:hypothetical protein